MKIQYIRKLTASYMVLAQCEELQEWEKKMIAHAPKGNIVFAECVQENGEKYLWYNITGKQALDAVLETETFSYDMLCNVLNGIYEAVQQLEGMLLPAQSILLSAESIFVDYRTRQISFCYYPGNPMPLPEAFRTFMEYLLTRLDHSDERAVKAAYDIYGQSSAGGVELKELKSLLLMPYEKDEAKTEPEGLDDTEPEGSKAYATVGQKEQGCFHMEADFSRREHGAGTACGSVGENMENDRHSCRQTGGRSCRQTGRRSCRQTGG